MGSPWAATSFRPSSYLIFFLIPLLILCFWKEILRPSPPESTGGIQGSVGRIYRSASKELCQCTSGLANAFSSKPWPPQGRHYRVRRSWDLLLGGLELCILPCRKCCACLLPDLRQHFLLGFQGRKWSEAKCDQQGKEMVRKGPVHTPPKIHPVARILPVTSKGGSDFCSVRKLCGSSLSWGWGFPLLAECGDLCLYFSCCSVLHSAQTHPKMQGGALGPSLGLAGPGCSSLAMHMGRGCSLQVLGRGSEAAHPVTPNTENSGLCLIFCVALGKLLGMSTSLHLFCLLHNL